MAKILIVDDDAVVVEMVRFFLTQEGFEVASAMDGYSVIQMVQNHKPDLIILDFQMPAASGAAVLDRVRNNLLLNTPVIFLSGIAIKEIKLQVGEPAGVRFLEKPVNLQVLKTEIDALLGDARR